MTDRSVDQEIEANNERKDAQSENEGNSFTRTVDEALSPITDALRRDDADAEEVEDQRTANDADQRP